MLERYPSDKKVKVLEVQRLSCFLGFVVGTWKALSDGE
jgi:hypothetical protein